MSKQESILKKHSLFFELIFFKFFIFLVITIKNGIFKRDLLNDTIGFNINIDNNTKRSGTIDIIKNAFQKLTPFVLKIKNS